MCFKYFGAPLDLYGDPANQFVAGFVASPKMNLLQALAEAPATLTFASLSRCISITPAMSVAPFPANR